MKFFLALLCTATALTAQSVEGTVVNRVTGAPVDGVSITLNAGNSPAYKATTDAQGAFRIDGVKPGVYTPTAEKRGYIPGGGTFRQFQVVEGGQPVTLRAVMVPMGKVSGRVLDAEGKPIQGATVQMLASFGGPSVTTGASGNFSLQELVPATYTLSARPPKGAKTMELDGGRSVAWVMTYYPGVAQRSAASRITIEPGSEIHGQDIRLITAPVHNIHGTALDHKGEPVAGVVIDLADPARLTADTDSQATSAQDGTFEFREIPAGEWRLSASAERDGVKLKAFQSFPLGDRDIDRLELRLAMPFSIQGTVKFEGAPASPSPMKGTVVMLAPSVGGSDFSTGRPDEDGKFTAEDIYSGRYQVNPIQPGAQFYLASIRLGEQESPDSNVEFYSSGLPLTVTYRSDGGTVRGAVEDCEAATVVLVPQDLTLRRRPYIRNSKCTAKGGYEFTAVRPGEYYVLALNPSDPAFNFMSTDVDQGRLNLATRIMVRPNEATLADLHVLR
jgi:protocatechuate 3,4-dioxygenase beta subunit